MRVGIAPVFSVALTLSVAPAVRAQTPVLVSAGVPNAREPQVAVTTSGAVFVAFGAENTLYCASSADGGKTFAPPVKVAEAGVLSLGMRRGPRIAAAGRTLVISAVYGREGKGRDGDLLAWRSEDGGKTWQGPATVNDAPGAAREGLHGMAAGPDGTLVCAWLDLRAAPGGGTRLYTSTSRDGGKTWAPNKLAYRSPERTICECCHPSLAFDATGSLYVMWRNALGGSRDMYLARSSDGGATFSAAQKLGEGAWPLDACPMDGGMVSLAADGKPVTVWRRDNDVYLSAPGAPERRIARGQQPWLASGPGGTYLAWLAGRPGKLFVLPPGAAEPIGPLAPTADDPVIAAPPGGRGPAVVAWSGKDGAVRVARVDTAASSRR